MGMDSFAPYYKINGCFIVQNTSPQVKTISIFTYPINYMQTRDLLQIPGVAESDIRASLLKGELNHKIRANDIIVVCSDIDLLQFNANQKAFLQSAGIVNGLDAGMTPEEHETLRQLIHFVDEGPGDGFASGAYRVILPTASPFPTSITWYVDVTQTRKIVDKLITYNGNNFPATITYNMYDTDGVTIVHTVVDTITYSSAFESTRVRSIS
jgi:hypothetical protein